MGLCPRLEADDRDTVHRCQGGNRAHHAVVEREDSYVPPVMDVIASDDGVAVVFHPDASEGIVGDLIVFVDALQGRDTK